MGAGLLFWREFCRPCDVTVNRMAPIEGTSWAGHDLELFPLLARCLLGLGLNVASPVLNGAVWKSEPLPPLPFANPLALLD